MGTVHITAVYGLYNILTFRLKSSSRNIHKIRTHTTKRERETRRPGHSRGDGHQHNTSLGEKRFEEREQGARHIKETQNTVISKKEPALSFSSLIQYNIT